MKCVSIVILLSLLSGSTSAQWSLQPSGSTARLRGVSVVNDQVAWASGTGGTVLKTLDGGNTWVRRPVNVTGGAEDLVLDFRDIEAFDDRAACVLSIGAGELSRIYRTEDGGATWSLGYINHEPEGFLDALAFWNSGQGLALGDPVKGRFVVLTTDDEGKSWTPNASEGMPEALPGEGAFAASGTCLTVQGEGNAWFGTSAGRVFRSADGGRTWTVHQTPISAGNGSSGIFSMAFQNSQRGLAIGGDYKEPALGRHIVALTSDGGRTWRQPQGPEPPGYRSAVALLGSPDEGNLVAVGPEGTDTSSDGGETWRKLSDTGFHAVDFDHAGVGWAVGENGQIARFEAGQPREITKPKSPGSSTTDKP